MFLQVVGSESGVRMVQLHIEQFIKEYQNTNNNVSIYVPTNGMSALIGLKGSRAQDICSMSGARFDIDRVTEKANIRGRYVCELLP